MTDPMLDSMARSGCFWRDDVRCPPLGQVIPVPEKDEVIVFRDFIDSGLRFPLDPVIGRVLERYGVFLHQLTPNATLRLSIFMRVSRTMMTTPTTDRFVYAHKIHHQPKHLERLDSEEKVLKEDAQFACLNFVYRGEVEAPVVDYHYKWPGDWHTYWFYH